MKDALYELGNWVALVVSLALVAIWLVYGVLFRWNRRKAGTAFYLFLSALVAVFVLNAVTLWFGKEWGDVGNVPIRETVRLLVYTFGFYAVAWLVYSLWYNWRRAGVVLDLERRAAKARAVLDGKPVPETEEIEIP